METSTAEVEREILKEEWPLLRDLFKSHLPHSTLAYNYFSTMVKWSEKMPKRHFVTIYAPHGDWRSDGTFIAVMKWPCHGLIVFTLDPTGERLYRGLKKSKIMNHIKISGFSFNVDRKMYNAVSRAFQESNIRIVSAEKTNIYWMSSETSRNLTFECPEGYYTDILKAEHASVITENWPYKKPSTFNYITSCIEMCGGHGVFTKSDNQLVSWILKNYIGNMGFLRTIEEHKRKGLATIVLKSLSKETGMNGDNPIGLILQNNAVSHSFATKLGGTITDSCMVMTCDVTL